MGTDEAVLKAAEQAPTGAGVWKDAWRASLIEHRFYLAYLICYVALGCLTLIWKTRGSGELLARNILATVICHLPVIAVIFLFWAALFFFRERPEVPLPALRTALRQTYLTPSSLAASLLMLVTIPLFFGMFFTLKISLPQIQPFQYDALFAQWSTSLSGGDPTWRILQRWLGQPWITATLDYVYFLWFAVVHLTFYWQLFSRRRPELRLQFIMAFVGCWGLLGSVVAVAFSSAGPAFFGDLLGRPTPFDGLMAYLDHVRQSGYQLKALMEQSILWQSYVTRNNLPFAGISAMPSIHVSLAVLMALFGWRVSRLAGILYTTFAVLVFLGSVLLAFHYAIDGYAGAALTLAVWSACGWLARRVYRDHSSPA